MATLDLGTLKADLELDTKKMDGNAKKARKGLGGMKTSLAAVAAGAAVAGAAVAAGIGIALKAFAEQERVEAQLDAVLKSTQNAAGLTAGEIKNMATELQGMTTFGDEAIIGGQNLLLTFTNIGKEVFPQATETMLDMSEALGQDMKSSAVQLGKALNDPIKGVTALSRVGVSFTEEQKEQIAVLQESGDVVGAQTVILDELKKEFEGSAAAARDTFGGSIKALKNTLGDLGERIGAKIAPIIRKFAERIVELAENFDDTKERFTTMLREFDAKTGIITFLKDEFKKIWTLIKEQLIPAFIENKEIFIDIAKAAGVIFVAALFILAKAIQGIIWVVTGVIHVLGAFREGMITFGESIGEALTSIKDFVVNMFELGKSLIDGLINGVKEKGQELIDGVGQIARDAINKAKEIFKISSPSKVFFEIGEQLVQGLADGLEDDEAVAEQLEKFKQRGQEFADAFVELGEKAAGIMQQFKDKIKDTKASFTEFKNSVKKDIKDIKDTFNEDLFALSADFQNNVANELVDAEESLADKQKELNAEIVKDAEDRDQKKIDTLMAEIAEEQAFLDQHAQDYIDFEDEILEARRLRGLDSIELLKERFEAEKTILQTQKDEQIAGLRDSLKKERDATDASLKKMRKRRQKFLKNVKKDFKQTFKDFKDFLGTDQILEDQIGSELLNAIEKIGKKLGVKEFSDGGKSAKNANFKGNGGGSNKNSNTTINVTVKGNNVNSDKELSKIITKDVLGVLNANQERNQQFGSI